MALVAIPVVPAFAPTLFTPVAQGEVPASGGGTANFLRADATWASPPVSGNPRVLISPEVTGAGPWTWTGLNGDEAGLRGYEIVLRISKAAAAAHTFGIQFNGDTGANYADRTGGGYTSGRIIDPAFLGLAGELIQGRVEIPSARSGAFRHANAFVSVSETGTPSCQITPLNTCVWANTAAIARIDVIVATGTVDAGVFALYKLMDVT